MTAAYIPTGPFTPTTTLVSLSFLRIKSTIESDAAGSKQIEENKSTTLTFDMPQLHALKYQAFKELLHVK